MTAVLIILLLLALAFGVGAVIEGVFWALLICVVLLALGAWLVWRKIRA